MPTDEHSSRSNDWTALVVAAVGHRVLADPAVLRISIRAALDAISTAFSRRPIVIATALAEGADRLIAVEAAAYVGAAIDVALPMEPSEYEKDFATPDSRAEYRELLASARHVSAARRDARDRSAAYHAAGLAVLDAADVVIALWDGEPARGATGTAVMVAEARARRIPLAWIMTRGTAAKLENGESHGALVLERFPQA